ncbi:MAG TPA: SDR family oxidoreductase [Longimicrobium sp.]|nr:SDR family oxidoreductase [Longimicrobium sp.]
MPAAERVLVVGATQGTGSCVVQRLLRDGYTVRVLARNEGKANARFGDTVEIVQGDITRPDTLPAAMKGMDHLILTVGVTRRPAAESLVKATEYDGTLNVLAAARQAGLPGRFMYMGAIGTTRWSPSSFALNLIKGNTLRWRGRAEEEIRRSGLAYTIVHAGVLRSAPAGIHPVHVGQEPYRMSLLRRIGREDAAEVFVQALPRPRTRNTTFDAVWGSGTGPTDWDAEFAALVRD